MAPLDSRFSRQLDVVEKILGEGPQALPVRVAAVSGWSVGQQLDHLLQVARRSLDVVAAGSPPLARGINVTGRILLAVGWFPRGVGKSPKTVLPEDAAPLEALASRVPPIRSVYSAVRADRALLARREPVLKHPYFGGLTPKQALAFLVCHTGHHLKIVRDIRRAAR
jgi:hypothetical protein